MERDTPIDYEIKEFCRPALLEEGGARGDQEAREQRASQLEVVLGEPIEERVAGKLIQHYNYANAAPGSILVENFLFGLIFVPQFL
jgi:hypothetical protein